MQCLAQRLQGRIPGLIRELEGSIVHSQCPVGAQVEKSLHRLGRVHVLGLHEPAGLIGTNWQQGHVGGTQTLAHLCKQRAVAGVTGEEHRACGALQPESRPQGLAGVVDSASGPMLCRCGRHCDRCVLASLPPVQFHDTPAGDAGLFDDVGVVERRNDHRLMRRLQRLQRGQVQVVIVVVRDQDQVNGWQITPSHRRRMHPGRSCPLHGGAAF